jgi:hypothetical protein
MTSPANRYSSGPTADEQDDVSYDPSAIALAIERENGLLDELHGLKYGELPHGHGWAWDRYEDVRKSVVTINGIPHSFDPLTRKVEKL